MIEHDHHVVLNKGQEEFRLDSGRADDSIAIESRRISLSGR